MKKSNEYWNIKKNCIEAAKSCTTRTEFSERSKYAYRYCLKNKCLDEACAHMISTQLPRGYWQNKENCISAMLQCKNRKEFKIKFGAAYNVCIQKGWLNEVDTIFPREISTLYTLQLVKEIALKCSTYSEFRTKHRGAYKAAIKNNWLSEIQTILKPLISTIKYNKEKILKLSKECTNYKEFRTKYPVAYNAANKNGWLTFIKEQFPIKPKKPVGYWNNKIHCINAAKQCKTKSEFRTMYKAAYKSCLKNGWEEEVYAHLISNQLPSGYWQNKNNCIDAIAQCKTQAEFREKFASAYSVCKKNGWFDELCKDLTIERDVNKWSTYEAIKEEALKYQSRREFSLKNGSAYQAAHRLGIIESVCSHMPNNGNTSKRGIYAFEFPDNHVYVGLTYNFTIRKYQHLYSQKQNINKAKDSIVYRHMQETNLNPVFKKLHDYVDEDVAAKLEGKYLQRYIKNGWIPLNGKKTGALGGSNQYYTHKRVMRIAHSCTTLVEFRAKYDQAYQAARKHEGWLNEILNFLPKAVNQYGKFQNNYKDVMALVKQCKTYSELRHKNPSAVSFAKRHGFLDEIKAILPPQNTSTKSVNKYTLEHIKELASSCSSLKEFREKYNGALNTAIRKGWMDEIHKILPRTVHRKYTKECIMKQVQLCASYSDFVQNYGSMYNSALKNGWLEDIQKYFNQKPQTCSFTYDDIIKIVSECTSYSEFTKKYTGAYAAARKKGWINDVKQILSAITNITHNKNEILEIAKSYSDYTSFIKNETSVYTFACKYGWLTDIQEILPCKIHKPYTKEEVLELASECKDYNQFTKKYKCAYKAACRNGWIIEIQTMLETSTREPYTLEEILQIAKECGTYNEFRTIYASAYVRARLNCWLDYIKEILPCSVRKPYTKEEIIGLAYKCNNYTHFTKEYRNAYKTACRFKMLEEIKNIYS
jgi:hypothetical protein